MGFFSKITKPFKKVAKGIGKAIKKVGKGIWDAAKGVVKSIGKVVNKLGPVGMIAIGIIAPYAIGALAGMGGTLGTIGQALQAVQATIAAPFQAAGKVIGAGIQQATGSIGQGLAKMGAETLSKAVTQMGTKIGSYLGYGGGNLSGELKEVWGGVTSKWDTAFGTSYSKSAASIAGDAVSYGDASVTVKPIDITPKIDEMGFGEASNLEELYGAETYDAMKSASATPAATSKLLKSAGKATASLLSPTRPTQPQQTSMPSITAGDNLNLFKGIDVSGYTNPLQSVSAPDIIQQWQSLLARA